MPKMKPPKGFSKIIFKTIKEWKGEVERADIVNRCPLRVERKSQTSRLSELWFSARSLGGTHSCQSPENRQSDHNFLGAPRSRMSTRPLPTSSSLEDKAVFLRDKCKKPFNLYLHSWLARKSNAGTEPKTSHHFSNTNISNLLSQPEQQALSPVSW